MSAGKSELGHQYEYVAAMAQQLDGSVRETPLQAHSFTKREPLSVVAAITLFNFPLILSSTKIAPALAARNSVVHKPGGRDTLSALLMAEILTEAGVPAGVFTVVTGSGGALGDHLVAHSDVNKGLSQVPSKSAVTSQLSPVRTSARSPPNWAATPRTSSSPDADLEIPAIVALMEAGKFPVKKLISTYKLEDVNQAVADMKSGKTIKPILVL